jgi:hypothetical protein
MILSKASDCQGFLSFEGSLLARTRTRQFEELMTLVSSFETELLGGHSIDGWDTLFFYVLI